MAYKPKIDKGIPIPDKRTGRKPQIDFPFAKMKVGDSFVYTNTNKEKLYNILSKARSWAKIKELNWTFAVRAVDKSSIRIWRIK